MTARKMSGTWTDFPRAFLPFKTRITFWRGCVWKTMGWVAKRSLPALLMPLRLSYTLKLYCRGPASPLPTSRMSCLVS